MTREKFWEIVQILVQKDYWDAQSVPSKEVEEILTKSILIPKPKFKVGDVVKVIYGEKTKWEIEGRYYSPDEMKWYYTDFGDMIDHSEDELESVEDEK